jgi:hypothetical protein
MREPQTPRDKVLWALGESGGKLSISRLRSQTDLLKSELDAILEDLEKEDKIIIRGKTILLR